LLNSPALPSLAILQYTYLGVMRSKILCNLKCMVCTTILNHQYFRCVNLPFSKLKYLPERIR
jgi:hypothetical protein